MDYTNETYEDRKVRYKERLANLTMMSDIFARNVLKDEKVSEYILRIIMDDKNLIVTENITQADFSNLRGRSAILDCLAKSGDGRVFNIEVQQTNTGASPKRSRYYMSLLDANALNPGDSFDKLPETYLIFITEDDALQRGLPIIHFSQKSDEDGLEFGDGTHYIYVDSSQHTDTELGKLMHDFRCKNPDDMDDNVLTNRIRVLKETEEGVETMCREMEEIRNEGLTEGELERARQIAIRLSKSKMSIEEIADTVGESVQLVKRWLSESTAPIC